MDRGTQPPHPVSPTPDEDPTETPNNGTSNKYVISNLEVNAADIVIDKYVLCEFAKKRSKTFYIGKVISNEDDEGDIEVRFLKRSTKKAGKFIISNEETSFPVADVRAILPPPEYLGKTARTKHFLSFDHVEFGDLNIF